MPEPEQVAEGPDVATDGMGFIQDAVFADAPDRHPHRLDDVNVADSAGAHGGIGVDEQVRVRGHLPADGPVIQPASQPPPGWPGEQNGPVADAESDAVDVGEEHNRPSAHARPASQHAKRPYESVYNLIRRGGALSRDGRWITGTAS